LEERLAVNADALTAANRRVEGDRDQQRAGDD
jgi:hypothetical protein